VSSGFYDDVSRKWKIATCVSWQATGGDCFRFLRDSPQMFSRFEEAEIAGIDYSRNWVDNRLKKRTFKKPEHSAVSF
jgi:hypothetical protein